MHDSAFWEVFFYKICQNSCLAFVLAATTHKRANVYSISIANWCIFSLVKPNLLYKFMRFKLLQLGLSQRFSYFCVFKMFWTKEAPGWTLMAPKPVHGFGWNRQTKGLAQPSAHQMNELWRVQLFLDSTCKQIKPSGLVWFKGISWVFCRIFTLGIFSCAPFDS
jgi:hypothetical protein